MTTSEKHSIRTKRMLISIERDTYRATQAEMVSDLGILTFETIYHTFQMN